MRTIREFGERYPWAFAAYLLSAASTLGMIWGWRYLPLQDYPDWVYQGSIFARYLRGELPTQFGVAGALAPNSISTLGIGALALIVPAEIAGKLFLSAYALGFLAAGALLLRGRAGSPLFLLPVLTVWNFSFLHGNISYAFALPVLFVAIAYVLKREVEVKPLGIAVLSVALYLCHATAFVSFALLLVALFVQKPSARLFRRMTLGLAPSLVLWGVYAVARMQHPIDEPSAGAEGSTLAAFVAFKGITLAKVVALFGSFHPFYEPVRESAVLLVVLNALFLGALGYLLLRGIGQAVVARAFPVLAVALHLLVFALAPTEVAGLVNPGERFILPVLFLVAVCVQDVTARPWFTRGFAVLAMMQVGFFAGYGSFAADRVERFHQALSRHTQRERFAMLHESHLRPAPRPQGLWPRGWSRLPRHHPLLRQGLLVELERGANAQIFETGLLHYRGPRTIVTSLEELRALERIDAVAIVGDDHGVDTLAQDLTDRYAVVERGDGFVIMKRSTMTSAL